MLLHQVYMLQNKLLFPQQGWIFAAIFMNMFPALFNRYCKFPHALTRCCRTEFDKSYYMILFHTCTAFLFFFMSPALILGTCSQPSLWCACAMNPPHAHARTRWVCRVGTAPVKGCRLGDRSYSGMILREVKGLELTTQKACRAVVFLAWGGLREVKGRNPGWAPRLFEDHYQVA